VDEKSLSVYAATLTDAGGRRINEDAVYACQSVEIGRIATHGHLYIVADGTGAQEGGQTASSVATMVVSEHFYDDISPDIGESLRAAAVTAHEALYELAQKVAAWAEMSTTIVAAVLYKGKLYVAHVGDSRAYLIRGGQARLMTRDHVWLQDDENYGALTRWLGGGRHSSVQVDLVTETLEKNDVIILCSDGLTDVVDRTDIGALTGKSAPQSTARQLIELAKRRGTGDNVSVAVIHYGGKAPVPPLRRWAWAGAAAALLLAIVLVLVLTGGPRHDGGSEGVVGQPTTTLLPEHIEVDGVATAIPSETVPSVEQIRQPTSTPVPATDTPTPRPTRRVVIPTTGPTSVPTETVVPTAPASGGSGGGGGGGGGGDTPEK